MALSRILKTKLCGAAFHSLTVLLVCLPLTAQTTQGLISGNIRNSVDARPISGAEIRYHNEANNIDGTVLSDNSGSYVLPLLSPGFYRIRVTAPDYQAQEVNELELPVAGRVDLSFLARPLSDVWEAGIYRSMLLPGMKWFLDFYGPDLDLSQSGAFDPNRGATGTLQSSVSNVVNPELIEQLPLAGRDVFTMLVSQPGVTADTTTARSLGLSANGQRPSSSNFMLDGLEFNNYLVTGPLTAVAPEAIQEYRLSTSNFSADYGTNAGYIANAVTRSGGSVWHGVGYFNLENEVLNANDFQSNLRGLRRAATKEDQPGGQAGGPIRKNSLFISASIDYLRSRDNQTPVSARVPTQALFNLTAPNSIARQLLTEFPGPVVSAGTSLFATITETPMISVNRWLALPRVDYVFDGGKERLMGRLAVSRDSRPDFIWSPFKGMTSGMDDNGYSLGIVLDSSLRPNLNNEIKLGGNWTQLDFNRPHSNIPLLTVLDSGTLLPSSPIYSDFTNNNRSWQILENLVWSHGSHLVTMGGGVILRSLSGELSAGRDGQYFFNTIADFAADHPDFFRPVLDRTALPEFHVPDFFRTYRWNQYSVFVEDTWRVTPRFVLNLGVRYESFGAPVNVGPAKDATVQLGPGNLQEGLATGKLVVKQDQHLYDADPNDFSGRFGFSYSPFKASKTALRGGWGLFYDRMFDNVWQNVRNNNFVVPSAFPIAPNQPSYLTPVPSVLPLYTSDPVTYTFTNYNSQSARAPITIFQPGLRTPYIQSFFLGVQHQIAKGWSFEINGLGSVSRKLLTTDIVNRGGSGALGPISYRGNEGTSSYATMTSTVRYRATHAQFQMAYTLSHAIDNQSEILRNDYFNLTATRLTDANGRPDLSSFSVQYNSNIDRGSADFDQRQNLVFFSVIDLPGFRGSSWIARMAQGWKFSQMAAVRSGVPYSVFAPGVFLEPVYNNRLNLVNPSLITGPTRINGGELILPRAAFQLPTTGILGSTGRNAFTGPGFYNIDVSVSRTFPFRWVGEAGQLTFRADAFNFLNHANLNQPDTLWSDAAFGTAQFGRSPANSGLPILSPVNDTARLIQLIVRLIF